MSGGGYWAGLERPIAWCQAPGCRSRRARVGKDGRRLCPSCRVAQRSAEPPPRCDDGFDGSGRQCVLTKHHEGGHEF